MKKNPTIDYELLVQRALRKTIADLLLDVSKNGLPGKHYFYIDFVTNHPGVVLSDVLREEYPEDMTIAIQYEYWDLEVTSDYFSVVLIFDEGEQKIVVPFGAIIKFSDPYANFDVELTPVVSKTKSTTAASVETKKSKKSPPSAEVLYENNSNIISFEAFKNKKE